MFLAFLANQLITNKNVDYTEIDLLLVGELALSAKIFV
jgi:hypothetical protein